VRARVKAPLKEETATLKLSVARGRPGCATAGGGRFLLIELPAEEEAAVFGPN